MELWGNFFGVVVGGVLVQMLRNEKSVLKFILAFSTKGGRTAGGKQPLD